MDKKEFEGILQEITPSLIIDPEKDSGMDDFFLVLALVFNDLKNIKKIETKYKNNNSQSRPEGDSVVIPD